MFKSLELKKKLDGLQKYCEEILNDKKITDDTKISKILNILTNNKKLLAEENSDKNTFIHSMARAIDGDTNKIPGDGFESKCYNFNDKIIFNLIPTGYTRETAYKIKQLFIKNATPIQKLQFIDIIKDAYEKKNKFKQTPKYFAEKCDNDFYTFMNYTDNGDDNTTTDTIKNTNTTTNTTTNINTTTKDEINKNKIINRIKEHENDDANRIGDEYEEAYEKSLENLQHRKENPTSLEYKFNNPVAKKIYDNNNNNIFGGSGKRKSRKIRKSRKPINISKSRKRLKSRKSRKSNKHGRSNWK